MSSASKQPTLFEVFGRSQSPIVPEINEEALDRLTNILTSSGEEMGKVVLLRSPRAGYGKTLLLQAAHNRLSKSFRFLAVEPSGGGRLDGEVVLESVLRQLLEVLPASGGLTELDLLARRLFAMGLKPLLISGEIPSHDREGALFAIENRPVETFDFHHQQAATAHWTQANFEVLGPRLASELSEISGCGLRGCAYWVDLLFRYATTSPEKVERSRLLSDCVFSDMAGQAKSVAEEQLQSLLALLSLIEPVVLVFDETEGLSNQPEAGLRTAAFVVQLRQACPALTVILSVNEDVWETGLSPLMPGGLEDRLTEFEVRLSELPRNEAESLLRSRFGSDSEAIARDMEWPDPLSARAVLRQGAATARTLVKDEFTLEEPSQLGGALAGMATPPPLEEATPGFAAETFEEKAERILEPSSSFEPEPSVGFEATPQVENKFAEVVEPVAEAQEVTPSSEASSPSVASDDPFGESSPALPSEKAVVEAEEVPAPSPFEIAADAAEPVTEPVVAEAVAAPNNDAIAQPEEVKPSPFEAVAIEPEEKIQAETNQWSPESAVEHFAATQAESVSEPEPAPAVQESKEEPAPQLAPKSPFDEVVVAAPAAETVERSPFQQLEEEKKNLQALQQEQELFAARQVKQEEEKAAAQVVESSPFSVTETAKEKAPEIAQEVVAASPPVLTPEKEPEVKSSPFTVHQPAAAVEPEKAPASVPSQAPPERAPASPVQQAAPAVAQPAVEVVAKAVEAPAPVKSPFAATTVPAGTPPSSPFASSSASSGSGSKGQETEDVEELLSQFKKRFGQSDS